MKKNSLHKIIFIICLFITIVLLIGGAIVPPPFVIDSSIFTASGILFGFATLSEVSYLITHNKDVKIKHQDTEIIITENEQDRQ